MNVFVINGGVVLVINDRVYIIMFIYQRVCRVLLVLQNAVTVHWGAREEGRGRLGWYL